MSRTLGAITVICVAAYSSTCCLHSVPAGVPLSMAEISSTVGGACGDNRCQIDCASVPKDCGGSGECSFDDGTRCTGFGTGTGQAYGCIGNTGTTCKPDGASVSCSPSYTCRCHSLSGDGNNIMCFQTSNPGPVNGNASCTNTSCVE